MAEKEPKKDDNIIHLFTRKPWRPESDHQIIRLSPEYDGLECLYRNDQTSRTLGLKILCWAINKTGEVSALVPWLDAVQSCQTLNDPLNGRWEGYCDQARRRIFFHPPEHKAKELTLSSHCFSQTCNNGGVVQEIPDTIGTHAIFADDYFKNIQLVPVISWCLTTTGKLVAMIADEDKIEATPILPGDSCLISVHEKKDFKYFFNHVIANKIKNGDQHTLNYLKKLQDINK